MPRDIDSSINNIDSVELFKIDDLKNIAMKNYNKRLYLINAAEKIIISDFEKYLLWLEKSNLTRRRW